MSNNTASYPACSGASRRSTRTPAYHFAILKPARPCPLAGKLNHPLYTPSTTLLTQFHSHTYTWLNSDRQPIKVPAHQYIALVQKWIIGKITDPAIFVTDTTTSNNAYASGSLTSTGTSTPIAAGPTSLNAPLAQLAGNDWVGKASGFPENFHTDCKNIMRQMFRCYAHLYHGHWVDPFWHIGRYAQLNSCFVHFVTVAKTFNLISDKDMEPMQPLIDIWLAQKAIPAEAGSGAGVVAPTAAAGSAATAASSTSIAA